VPFLRCYFKNDYVQILTTEIVPETPLTTRSVLVRKVPLSATVEKRKILAINICTNCLEYSPDEDMSDMRNTKININEKMVDFLDCFQFCTKRKFAPNSQTKPFGLF
jgi:hypothetical protein